MHRDDIYGRKKGKRKNNTHTHCFFVFLFLPLVFGLMLSPSARKLTFWFPVVRQLATAGAWHGYNKTLRENYPILCPHLPKKKKKEERRRQKIWCSITYINLPPPLSFFLNGNVSKAFETHTGDPYSIHLTRYLCRVTLYILTNKKTREIYKSWNRWVKCWPLRVREVGGGLIFWFGFC